MIEFQNFEQRDARRIETLLRSLKDVFEVTQAYPALYPGQTSIAASVSLVALQYIRVIELRDIPFDDRPPGILDSEEKTFQLNLGKLLGELEDFKAALASRLLLN